MMPVRALGLGAADVGGAAYGRDEVGVVAEVLLPARDLVHRVAEVLPDRAGAVGRGHAAAAHVLEDGAVEARDVQPVDDEQAFVESSVHGKSSRGQGPCE
jgi:hypothetical protein